MVVTTELDTDEIESFLDSQIFEVVVLDHTIKGLSVPPKIILQSDKWRVCILSFFFEVLSPCINGNSDYCGPIKNTLFVVDCAVVTPRTLLAPSTEARRWNPNVMEIRRSGDVLAKEQCKVWRLTMVTSPGLHEERYRTGQTLRSAVG